MKTIAGYKVIKLLAKGGMAAIYLAEQTSLQRQVVLKVLNSKLDESIRKRFIDEGQIIASLKHPYIVTVFDVVSSGKLNFLAMEYLEGGDLENRLSLPMSIYDVLTIIEKIADALHTVHKAGIIHGDIKPANIIFRKNGCPLLTDFGISRRHEPKQAVDTNFDELFASPSYASPELIQGMPFDYRTDLYSLGIMMYEMLIGEKPFHGETEIEAIASSIQDPVPILPNQLKDFQPLLESLLAKTAEQRLSDAKLVTRFIHQYLVDHPELKAQKNETKLIDSDVIVEYVSKRKKKSSSNFLSPLILTLILVFVIWMNDEALWDMIYSGGTSSGTVVEKENQLIFTPVPVNKNNNLSQKSDPLTQLQESQQALQKKEQLLSEKDQQIAQYKKQLKIQQARFQAEKNKRAKLIKQYLRKADKGLKEFRLTTPLNNNALYFYQKVLEIEPKNKAANQGIKNVIQQYVVLASGAIEKDQFQKANQYISTGLNIDSKNKRLLLLKDELAQKKQSGNLFKKMGNFFKNL